MRKINILMMMTMMLALSLPVSAATVIHWTFDDVALGAADGVAMPDSDGMTVWREAATDHSGNGNHLTTWEYDWAGFNWTADSFKEDLGMTSTGGCCPAAMTWSAESAPTGIDAEAITPAQWTVEAIFKSTDLSSNRTVVGRDGRNVGGVTSSAAALYFSTRGTAMAIDYRDVSGVTHIVEVAGVLELDTWYHVAGVSDGENLYLYLNEELIGTTPMTGTSADTSLGLGYGTWTVARGMWADGHVDRFYGVVDEVAISDAALAPGSFVCLGFSGAYDGYAAPLNVADGTVGTLVGTAPNYDAQVTLHFKAAQDPNDLTSYPVNPAVLRHYVYTSISGADPNLALDGYVDQVHNPNPNLTDPNVTYGPLTLDDGAHYFWQVEEGLDNGTGNPYPAGDANNILGPVWEFYTVAAIPTFTLQPRPAVADGSGNASFSIAATSTATHYQWFKVGTPDVKLADGGIYSGATTTTLSITGATLADEGAFYCIAYNGDPDAGGTSSLPSNAAWLVMPRLVGYWKLDGNMTDSVAGEPGLSGVVTHDGYMNSGEPNYISDPDPDGPAGYGMRFLNDGEFMELPDSSFFNYYEDGFTIIYWYKQYADAGWRLPMSKFDIGQRGWLFGHSGANPTTNFIIEAGGANAYPGTMIGSQWNMVAVTYDPATDTLTAYSNGDENDQATVDLSVLPLPVRPIQIGGDDAGGTPFCVDAAIDEVRMYSYPLTPTEIATMYTDTVANTWVCVNADDSELAAFDLNNDCRVNLPDFALVASEWLECQRIPTSSCTW